MNKLHHINPNCRDSRFCKPHGEIGPIKYDTEKMLGYIKHNEDNNIKVRIIARNIQKNIGTLRQELEKPPKVRFIQDIVFLGLFIILFVLYLWTH